MIWNAYSDGNMPTPSLGIVSCGHIFAKPGREIRRPLGRDDWLLFYVASGSEIFELDTNRRAGPGSFILFKPGEPQCHFCDAEKTSEFYYVHFTTDESFDAFGLETFKIYETEHTARISEMFMEMLSELQTKSEMYPMLSSAILVEILIYLRRKALSPCGAKSESFGKIAFLVQHIHKHYSENETLDAYAETVNMSKYHFLRRFEEVTGCSPIAYRNKIRLSHAKDMLEDRSLSIAEIGESLGYSSATYFSDAFKKETGTSPSAYRNNIGRNDKDV